GTGNFIALGQTSLYWYAIAAAPNGDVYAAVFGGDIYKQTGGTGNFVALGQTSRNWSGITAAPNGDVYAEVYSGDIYKQTGGTGNFVALSQTSRSWYGIAAASNGDVYAAVNSGDIYKQTGGTGNFVALGQTSRVWYGMAVAPNGDVYAAVRGGDIYKKSAAGWPTDFAYGTTSSCLDGTTTNASAYLDISGQNANTSVTRYVCARNGDGVKTSALTIGPFYTSANVPTTAGHTITSPTAMQWSWASGGSQTDYAYGTTSSCNTSTTLNTYWNESSLTANTAYTRYACARNGDGIKSSALTIGPFYTAANAPAAPTVNTPALTTLNVTPVSGGTEKDMSIYIQTGSSCTYSGGLGYVQANGSISGSEVYQTVATWNTVTVTGLSTNTQYAFCSRARNANNDVTSSGATTAAYTLGNAPSAPTVNTPTLTTLNVNPVTGGSEKDISIYAETGSSCDYVGGLGYVQANGSINGSEVYQSVATWSTVTVTGLSANTQYAFCTRSRNGDNVVSSVGPAGTAY
ncbi:MAG TPA: hypothetical protein VIJ25_13710, partial [Methylococcales bacterium]